MNVTTDQQAREVLAEFAAAHGLDVRGGKLRRTSSRFCLGVEHGDYNGTELFGVGTDRFIWLAYKPNGTRVTRIASANFPEQCPVEVAPDNVPPPRHDSIACTWARFPWGVDYVLRRAGYRLDQGYDAVLVGNIPGGGMSRSASLAINLILTTFEIHGIEPADPMQVVDLARAVENDYIGSPCGELDQVMIYFARAGMGTHYRPADRSVSYVPLGPGGEDLRLVVLDTGTVRPGLEKSTYKIRRAECEELARLAGERFGISCLADVHDETLYQQILDAFSATHGDHCDRLTYLFAAQQRFAPMLAAWTAGDVARVGEIFRQDGIGLRDDYKISGPELETMCDIVRTRPGVLGERMLGGGDQGAAGALVRAGAVDEVRRAVETAYGRIHPDYAEKAAVHVCQPVDGVTMLAGIC